MLGPDDANAMPNISTTESNGDKEVQANLSSNITGQPQLHVSSPKPKETVSIPKYRQFNFNLSTELSTDKPYQ